jgi:putative membrane protein
MAVNAFFAFLHFVAAFGIFTTLFYEWLALTRAPTLLEAKKLQKCDMWYGIFAVVILVVGFMRVFYFEKGSAYYFSSHFFIAKLVLFAIIGVLSIYPTVQFLSWRKDTQQGKAPVLTEKQFASLRLVLRLEMVLLLGVVFCASMMAKGVSA